MILAGIDIGTNTLRLLVAEAGPGSLREIYSARYITRLGKDLERMGRLSSEAQENSLKVLTGFAEAIRRHSAAGVSAVGTSAFRNASNAHDYVNEVKKRTGLTITIISGEEEARLTLLGVLHSLKDLDKLQDGSSASAVVIDIGGGSTEIIVTRQGHAPVTTSLPLGAVYLTERFLKHDPPSPDELELLRNAIRTVMENQEHGPCANPAAILIGTAGTITTLAAMDQKLVDYDPDRINRHLMTVQAIDDMVADLAAKTLKERRAIPGLERGREDIILAGSVITQEIMKRFGFSRMIVSDAGLREGIIIDLHAKLSKNG